LFYGDIFRLNYFAPHNYKNPPNTFGNFFDDVTPDVFRKNYHHRLIFQQDAFRTVAAVLQQEFSLWKELTQVTSTEDIKKSEGNRYVYFNNPPPHSINTPLLMIDEREVLEQYPQDYVLLRDAWIERIANDPAVYLLHKTRIWFQFMNNNFDRNNMLLSASMGGLTVFLIAGLLCFQIISAHRWSSEVVPSLMLAWSAVLTALPLIIFLPENKILYLYWFYAASFIAVAHTCSQSVLFHEVVQAIQRYFEKQSRNF